MARTRCPLRSNVNASTHTIEVSLFSVDDFVKFHELDEKLPIDTK